jgi:hypothetical protein
LALQHLQGVLRSLGNKPPLVLGEGGEDVRHQRPAWRAQINAKVQGDDVPTSSLSILDKMRWSQDAEHMLPSMCQH